MNRKETERRIKRSFENAAPDRLDDIKKRLDKASAADGVVPMHMGKKKRLRDSSIIYTGVLAAVAAVLLIVNGIMIVEQGNRTKKEEMTVARTLTLDLENSVALDVNAVGQVVTVKTLDKDTAEIINGLDLTGTPSDVAVNAIVGAMYQNGCLGGEVTDIVVTETDPAAEPEENQAASVSADDAGQAEEAASENNAVEAADDPEKPADVTAEKTEDSSVSVDSAVIAALAEDNEDGKKAAVTIALADAGIKAENASVTKTGLYTLGELIFGTELTSEESSSGKADSKDVTAEEKSGEKADDSKAEDKKTEDSDKPDDAADEADEGRNEDSSDENPDKKDADSKDEKDEASEDADNKKDSASDNSADKKDSSASQSKKTYVSPILSGMGDMDQKVWFVEFSANGYTYSSIINLDGKVIYYSRKGK